MAKRKLTFEEGYYYHVFNRGIAKQEIFLSKGDLHHFLDSLNIMNNEDVYANRHQEWRKQLKEKLKTSRKPLVNIIAYALLPNHFHLIITPVAENGVSKFMHRIGTSHTRFINEKYERTGSLFQGKFKAVELSQFVPVEFMSVYLNLNYKFHQINPIKSLVKTSLFEYMGTERDGTSTICDPNEVKRIIERIGGVEKYKKYLKIQSEYFAQQKDLDTGALCFEELG